MFKFFDALLSSPITWPAKWRRLYLCTLPISVPLHIAAVILTMIGGVLLLIVLYAILWTHDVWTGEKTEIK